MNLNLIKWNPSDQFAQPLVGRGWALLENGEIDFPKTQSLSIMEQANKGQYPQEIIFGQENFSIKEGLKTTPNLN